MAYNVDDIDKIIEFKTWEPKAKVDELLRIDASQYTNLGTESSRGEIKDVTNNSRKIYKSISKLDPEIGRLLLRAMDI